MGYANHADVDEAKMHELRMMKAFIFDMDGVIIDSEPLHERASKMVFARYEVDIEDAIFEAFKGKTDRDVVAYLLERESLDGTSLEELLEQKRQTYAGLIDELQPINGVIAFLNQVKAQYRLALTTSASRRNKELAFQKFNLHRFFEVVVTSNDISKPKPDPEPYLVTIDQLGVPAEECVVIEDSVNGVLSAFEAGCFVVGITTSFEREALREAGAHLTVDTFDQLASHI